jgi:hypothetical protein
LLVGNSTAGVFFVTPLSKASALANATDTPLLHSGTLSSPLGHAVLALYSVAQFGVQKSTRPVPSVYFKQT